MVRRDYLKFALAAGVFAALWFLLAGLDPTQRTVGAVFGAAVTLWISEALPLAVTALISTVLLIILGAAEPRQAFSAYGDPVIMLFIGSFMLAKSMTVSGLDRRLALLLLRYDWATRTPGRVMLSMGVISLTLSLFVSNTAVTAMMLPIGLSVLKVMRADNLERPYATGLLLMLAWGSTVAVGTLISTPPNLIGHRFIEDKTGLSIGFLEWMMFGMPISILMLFMIWGLLMLTYARQAPSSDHAGEFARRELRGLGSLTARERNTLIAFFVALTLWVSPGLVQMFLGREHEVSVWMNTRITAAVAAVVGASCLFLFRHQGEPTLSWERAATIDWGTILLFGGGIALGRAMLDSGLAMTAGDALASLTGVQSLWGVTALSTGISTTVSELASNTASATTVVPVAIGLADSAGVDAIAPALGTTLGASLGFMLPISTPPNAIVYSSGLVPPARMMRSGIVLDLIGFGVIMLCLMTILPLMGLTR
jgi:solute carrier family 13 (sodium-dependent dicarboxylate transporter), member 2/3/5